MVGDLYLAYMFSCVVQQLVCLLARVDQENEIKIEI